MNNYRLFTDNRALYQSMLNDIDSARNFVYLETYIYGNDEIGKKFRDSLLKKAKEGLEIKILIDDFGSAVKADFFKDLNEAGAEIKFFRKFTYTYRIISRNNNRNHRKLLSIDNKIVYIGSSNINEKSFEWHELNLRLENGIAENFGDIFLENFKIADKIIFRKKPHIAPIRSGNFEIIRDVPSLKFKKIRKRKIELVNQAKKQVLIATPYFLPDRKFRVALKKAVKKNVSVKIILPKKSDVKVLDLLRNRYLGNLHKNGIEIFFYKSGNLHAKYLLADKEAFSLGSANLNYRSLYAEFELNLFGWDRQIASDIEKIFNNDLHECEKFDFKKYQSRSVIRKLLEKLLATIRNNL